MGGFSFTHLLILVIIAMIFFRPQKVGEVGKSLGKALRNFKEGLSEVDADFKEVRPDKKESAPLVNQSTHVTHVTDESQASSSSSSSENKKKTNQT